MGRCDDIAPPQLPERPRYGGSMSQSTATPGSFGPNAWLVDDMYDRFLVDPTSVSDSWREFFADYRPAPVPAPQALIAPLVPAEAAVGSARPSARPTAQAAQAATSAPGSASALAPAASDEAVVLKGAA